MVRSILDEAINYPELRKLDDNDREDIESLDWEHMKTGDYGDGDGVFIKFRKGQDFMLLDDDGYVCIWYENLSSISKFKGDIKNKSEFKRVLKMIGL